jgi:hypothetical protein
MYTYIYACICVRVCIYIQTIKERPSTVIRLACGNFFHLQVEWRAAVVTFLNPAENQVSCSQEWESRRDYTCPRTATYRQYMSPRTRVPCQPGATWKVVRKCLCAVRLCGFDIDHPYVTPFSGGPHLKT